MEGGWGVGRRSSRRVLTMTAKQEQEKQAEWAAFVSDLVKKTLYEPAYIIAFHKAL